MIERERGELILSNGTYKISSSGSFRHSRCNKGSFGGEGVGRGRGEGVKEGGERRKEVTIYS